MITCPPPLEQAKALTHKSPTARSMSSSERFGSADWSREFTDSLRANVNVSPDICNIYANHLYVPHNPGSALLSSLWSIR